MILVDDCSTDNTYEVACALSSVDSRIKILKTISNSGTYVAKNLGLLQCSGRYVAFQDCDDISHNTRIEYQVQAIKSNQQYVASACHYARFNENNGDLLPNRGERARAGLISLLLDWPKVREAIGFFDSVRVNADDEYKTRIRTYFGVGSICELPECKYYALLCEDGLTMAGHTANNISQTDFKLFLAPVRQLYTEYFKSWHRDADKRNLFIEFPQLPRPFKSPPSIDPFCNLRFSNYSLMVRSTELATLIQHYALHAYPLARYFTNILVLYDAATDSAKLKIDEIGGLPVYPIFRLETIEKTMKSVADLIDVGAFLFIENPADLHHIIGNQLRKAMYLIISSLPTPVTVSFIDCDAIYMPLASFNVSRLRFVGGDNDFIRSFALTTITAGGCLEFV
jgi:glycosyltransferase involved in cell wall biosynthesis